MYLWDKLYVNDSDKYSLMQWMFYVNSKYVLQICNYW